jgi:ubiquinone/menaquinone biosynthesis C-methylase UbiE
MWKGSNKNPHDTMNRNYIKNSFLKWPGFGKDSKGRIKVAELIKEKSMDKPSILDIPCGNCITLEVLKERNFDFDYHGADLTEQMLQVSLELYPELEGKLHKYYIQNMGIRDNSYDVVQARHIFEHIPDWKDAMRECIRIARYYVYFVFFIKPTSELEDIQYRKRDKGDFYMSRYNKEDVESVFKDYEFKYYPDIVSNPIRPTVTTDTIYEVRIG